MPCPSSFANWIEELNHRGIASGCGGGNYCPNDPVTRAQMAVFLLVTLEGSGYAPPPCTGIFADVACPSTYATWVEELSRRGIASGCGAGNYCPTTAVTRAQMAVFLTKTFGFTQNATPAGQKRIFLYTPESNLAVETDYSSNYHPIVFAEHVWQGGMPVAEVDTVTSTTHWTMTDHLGTPIVGEDPGARRRRVTGSFERHQEENRHLRPGHRVVGAVVATPAPARDPPVVQLLDRIRKRARARHIRENARARLLGSGLQTCRFKVRCEGLVLPCSGRSFEFQSRPCSFAGLTLFSI